MSDSCRTLLIHNIILQFDIHCQTVSNSYRTMLIQQYYYVNDIQCQTVLNKLSDSYRTMLIQQYYYVNDIQCQTVSNSVRQLQNIHHHYLLLCNLYDTFLSVISVT